MIHVLKTALNSPMFKRMQARVNFSVIDDINEVKDEKSEIILVDKRDNYAHPCPGTAGYRCCNYYTSDVAEGCPFDCTYCILQAYLGHKNIRVGADIDGITAALREEIRAPVGRRIGSGELSDSLALDHIFDFSNIIIPIVNAQDNISFEFKTKSDNIDNLLGLNPKNIIVSWSLNPQAIAWRYEHGAATLERRLTAAATCAEAGYMIGLHLDPVILYDNYKLDYQTMLEELFNRVPERSVRFVSISTLRGPGELISKMRERSDFGAIMHEDFIRGIDGKYRYFKGARLEALSFISGLFKKHWKSVFLYFCMEHESIWNTIMGFDPEDRESFERLFTNSNF